MKNKSRQTEKLDCFRAGLRVEDVDFKDICTPKSIGRENAYWRHIVDILEIGPNHDRATCNQLRIRRRQVLNGDYPRKSAPGLPYAAAGAAAGVAMLVGVGIWWGAMWKGPMPATRMASIDSMHIENAEFANNVDFYTWLEKQTDIVADSGGG
ncbi:MAG: hypothetical protein MAG794_00806 [Gammaproteobacteria bacterium]|nr:hypothetical protein [Gammaproteobacteria bacterium]